MAGTERLVNFPAKPNPSGSDIAYIGDMSNSGNEVQSTLDQIALGMSNINLLRANNLSDVASASASRTNLGLGSAATHAATDFLLVANNLSDLNNAATARTNLGLGTAAVQNVSFFLQTANNLSDIPSASTARTNLGLGTAAVKTASDNTQTDVASVKGATTVGHVATFADTVGTVQDGGATTQFLIAANNLSDVQSAATSRTNLGLGTAAVQNIAFFLQSANNLSDLVSAATARTNLGLGTAAVKTASGSGSTVASVTGSFTVGHFATFADTAGTLQDGGSISSYLPLSGGTMTGFLILNADPVNPLGAVTKEYADAIAAGFDFKNTTQAATTANLNATYSNGSSGVGATLTNAGSQAAFAVDGYTASLNDRILVKNQSTTFQNGIYSVTTLGSGASNWVLTRTGDYDTPAEIQPGTIVPVTNGTVNANTMWLETQTVNTIGTDAILFNQFGLVASNFLQVANNLSDVQSASTSRTNLGLGTAATHAATDFASSTLTSAHIFVGNGSNVATDVAVSGDLTLANTGAFTIANSAVTNAKLANMADQTIKGNVSGGSAAPSDLTQSQMLTFLGGTTGTGALVRATSPTLTTPNLDTPSALVLTNATGSQKGSTAGSFPAAGQVGEVISSTVLSGSGITLSPNANADITHIDITAGNWMILGNIGGVFAATVDNMLGWSNTASATLPDNAFYTNVNGLATMVIPTRVISINAPATYYLSCKSSFSSTAPVMCGSIYAIRLP